MFNLTLTNAALSTPKKWGVTPERLATTVAKIEEALAAGVIMNTQHKDIKETLNRVVDELRDFANNLVRAERPENVNWDDNTNEYVFIYNNFGVCTYINLLPGVIKKLTAFKGERKNLDTIIATLNEFNVLVQAFNTLKDKVKMSRQVREEKAEEAASLKKVILSAKDVTAALSAIDAFLVKVDAELQASLTRYITGQVDRVRILFAERVEGQSLGYGEFNKKFGFLTSVAQRLVNAHKAADSKAWENKQTYTLVSEEEIAAYIAKEVKYQKGLIIERFKAKLTDKTGQILSAKGDLSNVVVTGYGVRDGVMEADITYSFADTASFSVNLQVVWVTNSNNTTFYRTPLRFYNVQHSVEGVMTKMVKPTEEGMYANFK